MNIATISGPNFPTMKVAMTTAQASSIPQLNAKKSFSHITSFSKQFTQYPPRRSIFPVKPIKCVPESPIGGGGGGSLKDLLSGMVDERVEQILNKEENKVLLDGLQQASERVEAARRELADIERREMEAKMTRDYVTELESRAAEIEECQKEISEARAMIEEAERSLTENSTDAFVGPVSVDAERLESLKAASVAAITGFLAHFPITLTHVEANSSELILPLVITLFNCALFGVTFRYAVRKDLDNFQLKSGTCAAFGFVKGLGMLSGGGGPLELDATGIAKLALDGAGYVSESLLIFFFAGVALDFCMKSRILSPFPIDESIR